MSQLSYHSFKRISEEKLNLIAEWLAFDKMKEKIFEVGKQ